ALDDRVGVIAHETHRAVAEAKIRSAGVEAPVMELIALVEQAAGAELVSQRTTRVGAAAAAELAVGIGLDGNAGVIRIVPFGDAEDHVPIAVAAVAETGKHPAEDQVLAGRTLADHERVAGAIRHVRQAYAKGARTRGVLDGDQHAIHAGLV